MPASRRQNGNPKRARFVAVCAANRDPERLPRPVRDAAECRLDARDWETIAKRGTPAPVVAAAMRLTLPSARAALDAARERLRETDAAKQRS